MHHNIVRFEVLLAMWIRNNAKPDQTYPVFGCAATPALVRFLGDLKKRRTSDTAPSFTTEEKEHAIRFALQGLAMEPARTHFFVYPLVE